MATEIEWLKTLARARLGPLLSPEGRAELERYRQPGKTNRVYCVPLDGKDGPCVVVKITGRRGRRYRNRAKHLIRNLLYQEHDVSMGARSREFEAQRYREWEAAGLPVPQIIDMPSPNCLVIEHIPLPTLQTLLDAPLPDERKRELLAVVVRSVSQQHAAALRTGNKGLVHRDGGPWNVLADPQTADVYWFDLEQSADYPNMTVQDCVVRGLRIFLHGVLDQMEDRFDDVVQVVRENYEHPEVLHELGRRLQAQENRLLVKVIDRLGLRQRKLLRERRLAAALIHIEEDKEAHAS